MACGCKGNQNPPAQPTTQQVQTVQTAQPTNESVKSAIKKTIEKYYNVNKSSR